VLKILHSMELPPSMVADGTSDSHSRCQGTVGDPLREEDDHPNSAPPGEGICAPRAARDLESGVKAQTLTRLDSRPIGRRLEEAIAARQPRVLVLIPCVRSIASTKTQR